MNASAPVERPVVKIVERVLAYVGHRRAKVTTTHHDTSRMGLRTVVMEWIDDADIANGGYPAGTVTREVIKGNGMTARFEVIEPKTVIA